MWDLVPERGEGNPRNDGEDPQKDGCELMESRRSGENCEPQRAWRKASRKRKSERGERLTDYLVHFNR